MAESFSDGVRSLFKRRPKPLGILLEETFVMPGVREVLPLSRIEEKGVVTKDGLFHISRWEYQGRTVYLGYPVKETGVVVSTDRMLDQEGGTGAGVAWNEYEWHHAQLRQLPPYVQERLRSNWREGYKTLEVNDGNRGYLPRNYAAVFRQENLAALFQGKK